MTIKLNIEDYYPGFNDADFSIEIPSNAELDGNVTIGDSSSDTLTINAELASKIKLYPIGSAAESASGLLMGVGTTADPATTSTANANFVEIRAQTTATSGDNRLSYFRYDINGAGAGGECIRAFTKLSKAASTARGAHISLDLDTAGSVTGLGVGVDNQWLVSNAALSGGTYAVANFEAYAGGASTDISGVTISSFQRFVFGGDATGKTNIEDNINFFEITGGSVAASNMFAAKSSAAVSHTLRVNVYGTTYYLMVSDAQ